MKQLAIIGSTASGKSDLALALATEYNAVILSIDSLSIYQDIDIASAKPSKNELALVTHFGINALRPDETASVFTFIDEYRRAVEHAQQHHKNLLIVGGSSFYLKSMVDGLSHVPLISESVKVQTAQMLNDPEEAHRLLSAIDPNTMAGIHPSDRYRIEKMLHLYLQTQTPPSQWFEQHPPLPIIEQCPILNIQMSRDVLRQRIAMRTDKMIQSGLIDEVAECERLYGRAPNSMKAIGMIETLNYLDGKIRKHQLHELISTHTAQLAKRQQTFNTHQFSLCASGSAEELMPIAVKLLEQS
ncbi:MAG TPA: tRNA (adenosine(37)-N6)-dimethylallyltransferase MiaA [Sulfuricurvum sp.]|nr:tRNA (adenosine(37)-N6)-dimethylallyltransferase MiaA [Sulfuricurvum sp.]